MRKHCARELFPSIQHEGIAIKAYANIPYLKATIEESLRISSAANFITPRIIPKNRHTIAEKRCRNV